LNTDECGSIYCESQATSIANIYSFGVAFLGFGLFLFGILYDWLNVFRSRIILGFLISTSYPGI
jgi:hypothetical protein